MKNFLDDKEFTKQKRDEAITRNQERAELSAKEKAEKKQEREKYAMNEMMRVRNLIIRVMQFTVKVVIYASIYTSYAVSLKSHKIPPRVW